MLQSSSHLMLTLAFIIQKTASWRQWHPTHTTHYLPSPPSPTKNQATYPKRVYRTPEDQDNILTTIFQHTLACFSFTTWLSRPFSSPSDIPNECILHERRVHCLVYGPYLHPYKSAERLESSATLSMAPCVKDKMLELRVTCLAEFLSFSFFRC